MAGADAFMSDGRPVSNTLITASSSVSFARTQIEKQVVCESFLHVSKWGCSWTQEMDDYIKKDLKMQGKDGQKYDCNANWCALFVAYVLGKSYEKSGLDIKKVQQILGTKSDNDNVTGTGYNWAVRYLVRSIIENGFGSQSLIPRVGSIFFRDAYKEQKGNGDKYNHTGIVVRIDEENERFWTIEGNVNEGGSTDATKSEVRIVQYDFSEIADVDTDKEYKFTSKTGALGSLRFGYKMRFLHLTEQGGTYTQKCTETERQEEEKYEEKTTTTTTVEDRTDCIIRKDCVEHNKYYRYAFYTDDGWYVYSGDSGFWKYGAKKWLKLKDAKTCEFVEVKCVGKCGCEGGGCDCQTLQDKLDTTDFENYILENSINTGIY